VRLIVGLGNPGPKYEDTRHNLGFRVVDAVSEKLGNPSWREKFSGVFAQTERAAEQVGLLKPMTFMNLSGRSVQAAKAFYKVPTEDLVVVHDELDLPFGQVRLKAGGGDAGHNGLRSISEVIGPDYTRLRIGVGRPPPEFRGSGADFVLQALAPAEQAEVGNVIGRAVEAVLLVMDAGLSRAMNQTNQRTVR
jgi:peptidyl-tRNA hydrolase, PTH1 family